MNDVKLRIEEHTNGDKFCGYENIGYYYDLKTKIGVIKRTILQDLEVGGLYDFEFIEGDEYESCTYLIIKKEADVYYMIEYYDKPYKIEERQLTNVWIKCDVLNEIGIDLSQYCDNGKQVIEWMEL